MNLVKHCNAPISFQHSPIARHSCSSSSKKSGLPSQKKYAYNSSTSFRPAFLTTCKRHHGLFSAETTSHFNYQLSLDSRSHGFVKNRHGKRIIRQIIVCSALSENDPFPYEYDESTFFELPCLPFKPSQVFVPASTKTLHLYEDRFLALLDEAMNNTQGLFVHFVVQPMKIDEDGSSISSLIASYGCIAKIENVKQLSMGSLITVRGIGRVKLINFTQLEPYLKGRVVSLKDDAYVDEDDISLKKMEELRAVLSDVQQMQLKIKYSKPEDPLETPLNRALQWATGPDNLNGIALAFLPSLIERTAFAALQPVAGASGPELERLLRYRLSAMEEFDSIKRLDMVFEHSVQLRSTLAAKLALQDALL